MRRSSIALVALLAVSLAAACAHERTVIELVPGEASKQTSFDPHRQSLVVRLRAGDVVPLDVVVEGDLFGTAPGAAVPITVKKDCWLRVDDRGFRLSEDGKDFDRRARVPGTFQLGVGVTPEGTRATLKLATPVR